jgi:Fur family ferric uptake transcriptional regulator
MIASTQTNQPFVGSRRRGAAVSGVMAVAAEKMRSAGGRVTKQRLAMLEALAARGRPATIEQIHADVGAESCDLVTIYRSMAAFEQLGLVRRSFFHNGTALYELTLDQPARYHVYCKASQRVETLDADLAAELRRAIDEVQEKLRSRGFGEVSHMVEFFGVAPGDATPPAPAPAASPRASAEADARIEP